MDFLLEKKKSKLFEELKTVSSISGILAQRERERERSKIICCSRRLFHYSNFKETTFQLKKKLQEREPIFLLEQDTKKRF